MQTTPSATTPETTATQWTIDGAHSAASFSVRHMMITNVRGEFQKLSGHVSYDPKRPESAHISAAIDVASISTREGQRDAHLRSPDFFDADKHPQITFESTSVRPVRGGELEVKGNLTIRGTTREIVLHVEGPTAEHVDPWGKVRVGAQATAKIRRSEFGMTWNSAIEAGGVLVGDEVSITLDVSLVKQS